MNILIATSEAVPFAKTGGLADVSGALPIELRKMGHYPILIMPAYRQVQATREPIDSTAVTFEIPIGSKFVQGRFLRTYLPKTDVPVYLVEQPEYFDRPGLYGEGGEDYKDNCERFVFFSRAVMESIRLLELPIDVLHCNDWQTGLIPAYLKIEYAGAPQYEQITSLLTIHNLAYQGCFWHWDMLLTGLDWKYFNWRQMEFYDQLNLLKTGIVFADAISTVSPQYAREIQTHPLGCGLEGVLQQRREVLHGILNGIDYQVWDPRTDPLLPIQYDVSNWREGKRACKLALQRELGLPEAAGTPLVGLVGRLVDQKGWDLVAAVMQRMVRDSDVQWVVLGTGELSYQQLLSQLSKSWSGKIAARFVFSEPLAHLIEAGADIFMMPSRYEPCGLNQLYSLRYGTVPVVRATGGLADTIVDATPENLAAGTANGFSFQPYESMALDSALRRAIDTLQQEPRSWEKIVTTGMKQDWSWGHSAQQYATLYESLIRQKKSAGTVKAKP